MYSAFLFLHSLIRWVALGAGVWAIVRAASNRSAGRPYERRPGVVFVSSLHLNFLLGLILFGALSPITTTAFGSMGAAMKTSAIRFFLVEHPFVMVLAVVLATVGSARIRRTQDDARRNKLALIFYGVTMVLLLVGIPWPFYSFGRSLLFLGF